MLLSDCAAADTMAEGMANGMESPSWQGAIAAHADVSDFAVAIDENSWRELWQRIGQPAPSPLPEGQMAVAVFLGQKRSGGYKAEIVGVQEHESNLTVSYREHRPRLGAMVTQVITSPYAVTLLPLTTLPVKFEKAD